ncbi:hypothetical protein [Thermosporothrix hazakensis]|uniref:hypothetical protein n=1 Tax=Thermosporothrix hazakensis TaxID=644383 RepID=UPI000DABEDC2|nr:hypothetical protein [Thermosporothrix hazakensis]
MPEPAQTVLGASQLAHVLDEVRSQHTGSHQPFDRHLLEQRAALQDSELLGESPDHTNATACPANICITEES